MNRRYRRFFLSFVIALAASFSMQPAIETHAVVASPPPEPGYAKWGRLAVSETMKRYPDTQIIDYLHIGRTFPAPGIAQESFKLLLKKNGRIRAVYVRIRFETASDKLIRLTIEEAEGTAYSAANRFISSTILSMSISAAIP